MAKQPSNNIFKYVLSHAQDVTDTFDVDLGGLPADIIASHQQIEPHLKNVRSLMEASPISPDDDLNSVIYGLINMAEWKEKYGKAIEVALHSGNVVAVDGTPLIQFQRFLTAQVYACAIGTLTYNERLSLKAQVIKTQAEQSLFLDCPPYSFKERSKEGRCRSC